MPRPSKQELADERDLDSDLESPPRRICGDGADPGIQGNGQAGAITERQPLVMGCPPKPDRGAGVIGGKRYDRDSQSVEIAQPVAFANLAPLEHLHRFGPVDRGDG